MLENNSKLADEGRGSVKFAVTNVYYVLNLTNNLLSVRQLQEKRLVILIKEGTSRIYHQQRGLIMNTQMMANCMFSVHAKMKSLVDKCLKIEDEDLEALWHKRYDKCLKIEDEDLEALWHKRYGHLNSKSIQIM